MREYSNPLANGNSRIPSAHATTPPPQPEAAQPPMPICWDFYFAPMESA
jgi:hypothetical protein